MTQCALMCLNVCKQLTLHVNKNNLIIHYKGWILLHNNRITVVYMTIKLCPSPNPITIMFTTELHVYKQQPTPTKKMC